MVFCQISHTIISAPLAKKLYKELLREHGISPKILSAKDILKLHRLEACGI